MAKINLKIPKGLEEIVLGLEKANGKAYLVGGAVIDSITCSEIKDWDVEVYGLNYQKLQELLSNYGNPNLVGQSFGIVKLRQGDIEYDFNIPRKESKIGIGHKGFSIELTPDITPQEAAYRRDLTINSMFVDLRSMELVDYYGGRKDLDEGILRHTSPKFVEDPLRVLRIMQLLPRKGKVVAPETIALCKSMVEEYGSLAKERVFEEWSKLLMKSNNPSMGLKFLVDCGWISHYPELDALRYTLQNPGWHPEGMVWEHNLMIVDNAARLRELVPKDWREAYMFGCLLHDIGKPSTTAEDLTAHGHDKAGVALSLNFMRRITDETDLTEKTIAIVENHMRPGNLAMENAGEGAWKRLHNAVPLNVIAYVSKADSCGRTGRSLDDYHKPSELALKYFEKYGQKPIQPILMGRDLVARGYPEGPLIGKILKTAYGLQIDEGMTDKNILYEKAKQIAEKID